MKRLRCVVFLFAWVGLARASGRGTCTVEVRVEGAPRVSKKSVVFRGEVVSKVGNYCSIGSPVVKRKEDFAFLPVMCRQYAEGALPRKDPAVCDAARVAFESAKVGDVLKLTGHCSDGVTPKGAVGGCTNWMPSSP